MKTRHLPWVLALIVSTSAHAQRPDRRPPPPNQQQQMPMPPPPSLVAALDGDGDGVLSRKEVRRAADAIERMDEDRDGEITMEELHVPQPPPPPPKKDEAQADAKKEGDRKPPMPPVIKVLDTDGDGTVSATELEAAPESLKELDKDGDGALSPEELRPHGRPPGPPPEDRKPPADEVPAE